LDTNALPAKVTRGITPEWKKWYKV
jgi:hypothetical protein